MAKLCPNALTELGENFGMAGAPIAPKPHRSVIRGWEAVNICSESGASSSCHMASVLPLWAGLIESLLQQIVSDFCPGLCFGGVQSSAGYLIHIRKKHDLLACKSETY